MAASEALALGSGGVTIVSEVTSLAPGTIRAGIRDLRSSAGDLGPLVDEGRQTHHQLGTTLLRVMGVDAAGFGDDPACGPLRGVG